MQSRDLVEAHRLVFSAKLYDHQGPIARGGRTNPPPPDRPRYEKCPDRARVKIISLMCSWKRMSWEKVTPRCLWEWVVGTGWPPKYNCGDAGVGELDNVSWMVLVGLNDMIHCWPYWYILSRSFCRDCWVLIISDAVWEACREVSSAKNWVSFSVVCDSWFRYKRAKRGPRTEPWGQPALIFWKGENEK